jgi:DNA-binding NtrC family response regulator
MPSFRILIIDDDQTLVHMLTEWLEMNGHQVTGAQTADEETWFSQWQWQAFDCIITGINQPGLNGLDFTKMVQAGNGPPVVVMSGYMPATARAQAFEAGAAAFLEKPFDLQEMLKILEICCGGKKLILAVDPIVRTAWGPG